VDVAEAVAAFVSGGVAVVVATRDAELRPEVARAWGPAFSAGRDTITLCIGAPPESRTRANLQEGRSIAATFSRPTTYRTVQIKGEVLGLEEPTPQQLARVDEHFSAFARETEQVGLSPDLIRRLVDPVFVAVTFAVRELYDQTPGPNAGARL
jgi:hypothetical protein